MACIMCSTLIVVSVYTYYIVYDSLMKQRRMAVDQLGIFVEVCNQLSLDKYMLFSNRTANKDGRLSLFQVYRRRL